MLIIIISRSSLKLDHVGSKTRLLGHQATQVSDLGPLWPSCLVFVNGKHKGPYYTQKCFVTDNLIRCGGSCLHPVN